LLTGSRHALDAWISLAVVIAVFPLMAFSRLGPDIVLLGAVILLLTLGIIDPSQALGGFASTGLFTVAFMYVLVTAIRQTGGIDLIIRHVLGQPRGEGRALMRLLLPVASLSGFLNNTPVVATYIPAVLSWSRRVQLPAHRLLMPLSFASILGGTITLFGTSTNLVVHGLLVDRSPELAMGIFDIAWVGVPVAVIGLVYLILLGPRLLPARRGAAAAFENPREFTIEMEVDPAGPLVNRTVEEAGLRHLQELFLVEIERDGNVVSVVGPGERLKGGDRLVFAGTSEGAGGTAAGAWPGAVAPRRVEPGEGLQGAPPGGSGGLRPVPVRRQADPRWAFPDPLRRRRPGGVPGR
jgi:di/tricarboxylate transporter